MPKFVLPSLVPRAAGRRITGSAFGLGGLALVVSPTRKTQAWIPRQRPGRGEDCR